MKVIYIHSLSTNSNIVSLDFFQDGVTKFEYELAKVQTGIDVIAFLAETKIFPSKGEARKMVQGGGVSINKQKVPNTDYPVSTELLLNNKYLLVQKGKKNYYLVTVA